MAGTSMEARSSIYFYCFVFFDPPPFRGFCLRRFVKRFLKNPALLQLFVLQRGFKALVSLEKDNSPV